MKPLQTIECPSCGGAHEIYNPGIVTITCNYCGNALFWDDNKIKDVGKQAILTEGFSRFYRGATGTLQGKRFLVLGRARYRFDKGFWDEWFIEFSDQTTAWLSEDNHEIALEQRLEIEAPQMEGLSIGERFSIQVDNNNTMFHIEEVGDAECIGIEGSLPKQVQSGEKYPFADGSSLDGTMTFGIEYDNTPPTLFVGHYLAYDEVKMDDEGAEW